MQFAAGDCELVKGEDVLESTLIAQAGKRCYKALILTASKNREESK